MCPFCLATMGLSIAGAASTGGLAALAGKVTLADLFDGKSQLIIYHFMFGPDWQEGCPSCSFNMDHTDGALVHLAQRDVSFAAVSRAPMSKIEPFKKRMGWKFT